MVFKKGSHHSEKSKIRISLKHKGEKNYFYGKQHSIETKMKISIANTGKKRNEEDKKKMSDSQKKRWSNLELRKKQSFLHLGEKNYMYQKNHTKDTKEKIKLNRGLIKLPLEDSSIEIKIQNFLKQLKIEFFTHQYMKIQHSYRCDIFIPSKNLIIECDGDYWHGNSAKYNILNDKQRKQRERDEIRTQELLEKGYNVWRIWENEIRKMSLKDFNILLIKKQIT